MVPKRFKIKFFIQEPESVSLEPFIPIFHRWIQEKTIEGLLIDVANYKHIQNGPGVILLGDQVDYAIDLEKGHPGLLLRRKRPDLENKPLQAQLRDALLLALRACRTLETDPALQGRVTFQTGEVEIAFQDRLSAPNVDETFIEYSPVLQQLLKQLYPNHNPELQLVSGDPREAFAVHARAHEAPGLDNLIWRLENAWKDIQMGTTTVEHTSYT